MSGSDPSTGVRRSGARYALPPLVALAASGVPCLLWQLPEDTVFPALVSTVMASYALVGRMAGRRRANDGAHASYATH